MNLEIKDLHVSVDDKVILKGINLVINSGEVHALMGPNGGGKSTLSFVLAGHPRYKVTQGDILVDGKSILSLPPSDRAKLGFFLSFQNPVDIPGVSLSKLLFSVSKLADSKLSFMDFRRVLNDNLLKLGLSQSFVDRELVGLSGGEKKRAEVLQLLTIKPHFAVLDELDSGLDVDSLKILSDAVNSLRSPNFSALVVTHYQRLLNHIKPDFVHIFVDGKIVLSGDFSVAQRVELEGYTFV